MTDDNIDPGLSELLNELAQAEKSVTATPKAEESKTVEPKPAESIPTPAAELPPVESMEVAEEAKPATPPETFTTAQVMPADPNAELVAALRGKLLGLVDAAIAESSTLSQEMEVDRKKCDDIYNMLQPKIQSGEYSGQDAAAFVGIMQVKAEISSVRTKKIDSLAKLLVALKSNATVVGQAAVGGGASTGSSDGGPTRAEVQKLLDTPIEDDD